MEAGPRPKARVVICAAFDDSFMEPLRRELEVRGYAATILPNTSWRGLKSFSEFMRRKTDAILEAIDLRQTGASDLPVMFVGYSLGGFALVCALAQRSAGVSGAVLVSTPLHLARLAQSHAAAVLEVIEKSMPDPVLARMVMDELRGLPETAEAATAAADVMVPVTIVCGHSDRFAFRDSVDFGKRFPGCLGIHHIKGDHFLKGQMGEIARLIDDSYARMASG